MIQAPRMPFRYIKSGNGLVAHYLPTPMYDFTALHRWNQSFIRLEAEIAREHGSAEGAAQDWVEEVLQSSADGIHQLGGDALGRCRKAVEGLLAAKDVDARAVKRAHACLMGHEHLAFRQKVVLIGAGRAADANFIPPPPNLIPGLMDQALAVRHRNDLAVLLRAVVIYARVLHIHPYDDGNGKLARLLGLAMLSKHGRPVSGLCRLYRSNTVARGHHWLHVNYIMGQSEDWDGLLAHVTDRIQERQPLLGK